MTALRRLRLPVLILVSTVATVVVATGLARMVDGQVLTLGWTAARGDLPGLFLALSAFAAAFVLRAVAWTQVLPGLSLGHALAGIHLALGGNHLLPARLGEPLRVVSVVRRQHLDPTAAAASTATLRAADIVALLGLGLAASPVLILRVLGPVGLALVGAVAVIGIIAAVLVKRRRSGTGARDRGFGRRGTAEAGPIAAVRTVRRLLPAGTVVALTVVVLTVVAWFFEAVLVWQVLRWFDVELSVAQAIVVLAAAVASQLLALTPGGIGTYEAAASGALIALGVAAPTALGAAVAMHALKTIYSVTVGLLALVLPTPGLVGNLRLPQSQTAGQVSRPRLLGTSRTVEPVRDEFPEEPAGVLLFLPAYDEGPRVAQVIRRAPRTVAGHPVQVVVVDDGSSDDTVDRARAAGAEVVQHSVNLGLGAAVRTGLAEGVRRQSAAVIFCDADGEYDPADLQTVLAPVLAGTADYVVGSRFSGTIRHMRPHRRLGNQALTRWVAWTVRHPITDGQSGYRAFSPAAAAAADIPHDYNYAQVITIDLIGKGFRYAEVPIDYHFRRSGSSFIRLGRYLANVGPTVWRQLNPRPDATPS